MGHSDAPLDYDDLLQDFKRALGHVMSGSVLPPTRAAFDIKVTLALLDVAHAVRSGRPVHDLVSRACNEFSSYAAQSGAVRRSADAGAAPRGTEYLAS